MKRTSRAAAFVTLVWATLSLALLLPAALAPPAAAGGAATVAIVKSADLAIYEEAVRSYREALPGVTVVEVSIGGKPSGVAPALAEVDRVDPDLVLALGTRAAHACRDHEPRRPTLFAMVLNWERHGLRTAWMSGVAMEVPFGAQFFGFRLFAPAMEKLGVLYDPSATEEVYRRAADEAAEYGIEIVGRPFDPRGEGIESALADLSEADAFWMIPDPSVYTETNFAAVRSWCLRRRIPFFAWSESFVESGAFASISPHYGTIGYQVAVASRRILDGEVSIPELPVAPPIGTQLVLNRAVAARIGAELTPGALSAVDRLIR
jgi:putative ABC transport system substrate-binding protein